MATKAASTTGWPSRVLQVFLGLARAGLNPSCSCFTAVAELRTRPMIWIWVMSTPGPASSGATAFSKVMRPVSPMLAQVVDSPDVHAVWLRTMVGM